MLILNNINELKEQKRDIKGGMVFNKLSLNEYKPLRKRLKGKEYLVVPTTMIVEGVLNGIFYSKEEMAISTNLWNGSPVILNHPEDGFSANRTEIIENFGIGVLYNTSFDINDKNQGVLTSEVWFDPEELERIDSDLYNRVLNGDMVEVSTGLMINLQFVEAEFRGVPFYFVSSNYKPDHLAILPNNIGACSCADGCGLRQNESVTQKVELSEELSYDNNDNNKENNMSNCNCPNKVKHLIEISSLSENLALSLNEAQIDELISVFENKDEVEEVTEVAPVSEEVVEEAVEAVATEEVSEVVEVAEEVKEEVVEVPADETPVANEEEAPTEEVVEEPEVASETVEQPTKIDAVEALEEVVAENLCKEIKFALEYTGKAKANLVNQVLELNNNKFTKEALENKDIEELNNILAIAQPIVDYSLASNAVVENKVKKAVKPLSSPKYLIKGDK